MKEEIYSGHSLLLTNCGREDCSDLHSWGPGIRPCYIIHYVIKGAGWLECGKKRFRIEAGQSFLLYPYTVLHYYPDPLQPWEYIWVDFVGKDTPDLLPDIGFSASCPISPAIPAPQILPLFERLCTLDIHYRNKREACGLLLALLGLYADAYPAPSSRLPRREDNRLSTAVLLIRTHYHKPDFNVEALCRSMHMNRVTLYRLFRETLGLSPNAYICQYRLEQAEKLLEMGFSVKNTAFSCGYGDPFYFSRAFKARYGIPPAARKGK
nr:AraC family transcriptional regulator [uncultured Eisenbergiella sp.]